MELALAEESLAQAGEDLEESVVIERAPENIPPYTRRALSILGEYNYIRMYDLPYVRVIIIGKEGSGKTNTGYDILQEVKAISKSAKKGLTDIYFQFSWSLVDEFFARIEEIRTPWAYVFLDDFSFVLDARTKETRDFLNKFSKIRHLNKKVKKWFIVVATHYSKATTPFIRQANVIVLTSLTTWGEFQAQKEFFTEHYLKQYWRMYRRRPWLYPVLVNSWGLEYITRPPFYKQKKWTIKISEED